ncbi:MAG: MATE family efflux transporter [Gammaproteobacteria bacterium]|nr:MATE family efflux transporter [Gammaproteobacteria bacterium]
MRPWYWASRATFSRVCWKPGTSVRSVRSSFAAYSFTFPVIGALMSISLGTSIGLSSVLARTVGAGDQTRIRRLTSDGITLTAVVMTVVAVAGYLTIDPLFRVGR